MHHKNLNFWTHSHTFGQDLRQPGEIRTIIVIVLTTVTMVIEVAAGLLFGSMALLADGLHMASHSAALVMTVFAYIYARRHANDARFSFGTGKVNALAGFTGAVLLILFSILMAVESINRFFNPIEISFNEAISVAILGFIVNAISMFILDVKNNDHNDEHEHEYGEHHKHNEHCLDHNLMSAYLHVLADALTSVFAIFALLIAKYFWIVWMDPLIGIIGATLVAKWSFGLIKVTSSVLLDHQAPDEIRQAVIKRVEQDGDSKVADIHIWSIGAGNYAVILSVVAEFPFSPEEYKSRVFSINEIKHISVEVHKCSNHSYNRTHL